MKNLTLVFTSFIFLSSSCFACLHFPNEFKGNLTEGLQEYFIFHDGKNAHMVLRTQLNSDQFPKEVAWVLPFPSLPSKYEEIDGPFFEEIRRLFKSTQGSFGQKGLESNSLRGSDGGAPAIKVHDRVDVGSFQIQPIEILKDSGSTEFNDWLKLNKFNPMPLDKQKKYLKKGAVFLAIRMQMNHRAAGHLIAKTLHVVYPSKQLSIPLLFTHDNRTFDLDLFVFSKKPLQQNLKNFFLEEVESVEYKNLKNLPFVDDVLKEQVGKITLFKGENLNGPAKKLKDLKEDPTFSAEVL